LGGWRRTSLQGHVDQCGGNDLAAHSQDAAGLLDGFLEVAKHTAHGHDKQVAKAVAGQVRAVGETILEESGHERLGVGQSGDAVPHVARRQDAQFAAQAAGAAAVVGHCDYGYQVAGVPLKAAQEDGKPRPATDGDDLRPPPQVALTPDDVHQA